MAAAASVPSSGPSESAPPAGTAPKTAEVPEGVLTGRKRLEAHPLSESPSSAAERRALLAMVWAGCLLFLSSVTIADPDLWGHTLYGLRTLDLGVLVERTDPFSYTAAGANWINHEWLTERLFAECWRTGGNFGLVLWRNVCLAAMFGLIWLALRRNCSVSAAWMLLVFSTECLANYVVFVRPQLATYVGVTATLLILRRQWDHLSYAMWLVPAGMVFWVNLHGGFLAGVALTGLLAAAAIARAVLDPQRRAEIATWVAAAALTGLATFINPYGPNLHRMLWDHLVTPQLVLEWQPIWAASGSVIYFVPFGLTLLALGCSRRWKWIDALVLGVIGWQAASHIRHGALFCVAVLVLLPVPLSDALSQLFPRLVASWSRPERRLWRWAAAGLILAFLAAIHIRGVREIWRSGLSPWDIAVETRSGVPGMPVAAVREMQDRGLEGNLLTDYGWGQFALWHLWPEVKVAFDGRYRTVYPAVIEAALLALQSKSAREGDRTPLLDDFPTQFVLAPAGGSLERVLNGRSDWKEVYRDGQAVLYAPRQAAPAESPVQGARTNPELPKWVRFPGLEPIP
jgi:hypothetical protein